MPHRDPTPGLEATVAQLEQAVRNLEARQRRSRLLGRVLVVAAFVVVAAFLGLGAGYAGYRKGLHRLARAPIAAGGPTCGPDADRALLLVHDGSCFDFVPLTDGNPPWERKRRR